MAYPMSFKRILIAAEPSEIAIHATLVGLELASALGAQIAFIHVIAPAISDGAWFAAASPDLTEPPDEDILRMLASLKGRTPLPAEAEKFVPMGDPVDSISAVARDWAADLVVIGSHGRQGIGRALLGSVAEGVARHAPCPVLIVRR